jgi:hypothetical protein
MDDRQHVSACCYELVAIFRGYAADGNQRQCQLAFCLAQQFQIRLDCLRFGLGGEETAKGDIVGTGLLCLAPQLQPIVTGDADDGIGPEFLSNLARIPVVFSQVNAVSACLAGQCHIVVDDQQRMILPGELSQLSGLSEPALVCMALVAILDDASTAQQGRFDLLDHSMGCGQLGISNGIESA